MHENWCTNLQAQIVTGFSVEGVQGHCSISRRGGGSGGGSGRFTSRLPLKWDVNSDKADREHSFRVADRPPQPFIVHLSYQQDSISFLQTLG